MKKEFVQMTGPDDIALNQTVKMLEQLADGTRALLRRRGYPDDEHSRDALAFLYPKYGIREEIRDRRKYKEDTIAKNLYSALLHLAKARAYLDQRDLIQAMNTSLMAVREMVAADLILAKNQRNSGRTGGLMSRDPRFPPKVLLRIYEDLLSEDPVKYRFAKARIEEIARISGKSEDAVKKALQRAQQKKGTHA